MRRTTGLIQKSLRQSSRYLSMFVRPQRSSKYFHPAMLLPLVPLLISSSSCDEATNPLLSGPEFRKVLYVKLEVCRKQIKKYISDFPSLEIIIPSVKNPQETTYTISFVLGPGYDAYSLLQNWLQVIPNPKTKFITGDFLHETDFISEDETSSLRVTTEIDQKGKRQMRVTLYKDKGFYLSDIPHIVEGYKQAILGSVGTNSNTSSPSSLVPFINSGKRQNSQEMSEDIQAESSASAPGGGFVSRLGLGVDPLKLLMSQGIEVFDRSTGNDLDWDALAGYDEAKKNIEETIINALKHPDVYDEVTRKTRVIFESNRPKAVLLEGPPGTGKTLTARILAGRVNRPLVHLKLENIVSKYYGQSHQNLAKIMDICEEMEGAIIFIDEIDSFASTRENASIHEETRRMLSLLLQRLEGFQGKGRALLVCATNRRQDLDPALLSRFDLSIQFSLPDKETRSAIFKRYAKQFTTNPAALAVLSEESEGLSCREIKEACEHSERQWATRKLKRESGLGDTPSVEDYVQCLQFRQKSRVEEKDSKKAMEKDQYKI